jgi:hypothetical protein
MGVSSLFSIFKLRNQYMVILKVETASIRCSVNMGFLTIPEIQAGHHKGLFFYSTLCEMIAMHK